MKRPARSFVEDRDHSGDYGSDESFHGQIVTRFGYVGGSNRIELVMDESTGATQQEVMVEYDTVVSWHVKSATFGEPSARPGQDAKAHTYAYPQQNRTV